MTNIGASTSGAPTGGVLTLLRAEGAALFAGATLFYQVSDAPWSLYALLFLVPDLSFLAYLHGPRAGAFAYNIVHATVGPLMLALLSLVLVKPVLGTVSLIWLAHIGLDRALGYGLKYDAGFALTHLGRIGKEPAKD